MSKIMKIVRKIPPFSSIFSGIEKNRKGLRKLEEELEKLKQENGSLSEKLKGMEQHTRILEKELATEQGKLQRLQKQHVELHELVDRRNQNMHDFVVDMHQDSCERLAASQKKYDAFQGSVKKKHASTDLQLKEMKANISENYAYALMGYNEYHKEKYALYQGNARDKRIIVSLTSYGKRIKNVHHTIQSLFLQSVPPDKIVLYLDNSCRGELTEELEELKKYGLEIVEGVEDLKPHKKYYYAMQEYPEDIIITVDDDLIYEEGLIQRLMESYEKYPHAISAKRVHRMKKDAGGKVLPYSKWQNECQDLLEPSMELLATNGAGTLFPPGCWKAQWMDKETFMKLAACQDDIWLKFMELQSGIPVVYVPGKYTLPPVVPETQEEALYYDNNGEHGNDSCIELLQEKLQVMLGDYCSLEEIL